MIDIHTHVLPNIDDGSESPEMSYEMLRASWYNGVTGVIATPHYYSDRPVDRFLEKRQRSFEALQELTSFPVKLGAEVYYNSNLAENPDIYKLCLGSSNYLLLELPFGPSGSPVLRDIEIMRSSLGLEIIIAHVERYLRFNDASFPRRLLNLGCLLQVNADSASSAKVKRMINQGMISFMASDMHNLTTRAPNLKDIPPEIAMNGEEIYNKF